MKILLIHTRYQFTGGEDAVVEAEARLLTANGEAVRLLLFDNSKGASLKFLLHPFNPGVYYTVKKVIKEFNPDIVHIHNLHFAAGFAAFYAVRRCHIPFVTTLHNYRLLCPSATLFHNGAPFTASLNGRFPWKAIRKGVYRNSIPFTFWLALGNRLHQGIKTFSLCNRYILLSHFAREAFATRLGIDKENIAVKPNFCHPLPAANMPAVNMPATTNPAATNPAATNLAATNNPAGNPGSFLYIGRLTEEKGIATLLDAFTRCSHKLLIAGDGPLHEIVTRTAQSYANIEYLGTLDKTAVTAQLRACTALVFPSLWPEGMPMVILEAFACGVPVIASRTGIMETLIRHRHNGLHFRRGDPHHLLQRLHEWTNLDTTQQEAYRINAGNTWLNHFTPQENYRQLSAIYSSVIQQYTHPLNQEENANAQSAEHPRHHRTL